MIAQSIYHGVSRFSSRGRKLVLKSLEARSYRKGERLREHNRKHGLEILAGTVCGERIGRRFRGSAKPEIFGRLRGAIPTLVIALELESEAQPIAADPLVLIPGD